MSSNHSAGYRFSTVRLAERLRESLTPERLEDIPSPHFYSQEVFEADFFCAITDALPDSCHYGSMGARTANPRAKSRQVQTLAVDKLDHLPAQQREFWVEMARFFRSDKFAVIALSAYGPLLAKHRPDVLRHTDFDIRFELLRDTTSYGIGPHSDHPNKVMTLLFYLSAGEVTNSLGTSFYQPKQNGFECPSGKHYPVEAFQRLKTYPYAPNAVLSFLRTNSSFHGVETITENRVERNILRWMLWKR